MHDCITPVRPPGLMKMWLMHHQEHHIGHPAPQNNPCMKSSKDRATPVIHPCKPMVGMGWGVAIHR